MGVITDTFAEVQANDQTKDSTGVFDTHNIPIISEIIDNFVEDYLHEGKYTPYYKIDEKAKIVYILVYQPATNRRNLAEFTFDELEEFGNKTYKKKLGDKFILDTERDLVNFTEDLRFNRF